MYNPSVTYTTVQVILINKLDHKTSKGIAFVYTYSEFDITSTCTSMYICND